MTVLSRSRLGRSCLLLAFVLLAAGVVVAADVLPASAQGYGFFGNLFGGGSPGGGGGGGSQGYPGGGGGYDNDTNSYSRYYAPRHRAARHKKPAAAVQQAQDPAPTKPTAPAKTATIFVDVFGDSLGQMLAGGLDDALADRADVGIVHKAKGSTGLVNTAFYDWPKTIDQLLQSTDAKDKIDVAVMMIGVNDRQPISLDGKTLKPGTEEWTAEYRKRVMAIDEAFAKKKIPLIWVGVPITKDDDFSDDMAAFNDIYRDSAGRTGATYVDTWEAFSDDDGNFAAFGPDINGQTVRLRASDGIHFTKAGARKLAHFVEAHVRRDLDGKAPLPQLPTAEAPASDGKGAAKTETAKAKDGKPAAVAIVKPEAGPIRNLGELPAAKGGELAQVPSLHQVSNAAPDPALVKGQPEPAPSGRADNFRWTPSN